MNTAMTQSVSIVIPAFNEAAIIGQIVGRCREACPHAEIIVVDDGSSDGTGEAARRAGAQIIRHPYNVGNGVAVKHGAEAALGEIVVMMDGDGQHPPERIPDLVAEIGTYDMVVAERTRRSKTSLVRNVGNILLIAVAQWISGRAIPDLTSGFRAIRADRLREFLHLFPSRYSYPTTITLAMMMAGHFVHYLPVDEITARQHGASNISPVRDFIRFIRIILRIVLLFSPERVFLPFATLVFLCGLAFAGYQFVQTGGLQGTSLILIISSLLIACFGFLADQIALLRRQRAN